MNLSIALRPLPKIILRRIIQTDAMPEQLERILRVTNVWKKNLPISVTEHGYIWGLIVLEIYQADFFSGWELTISPARPILQFVEALRDS